MITLRSTAGALFTALIACLGTLCVGCSPAATLAVPNSPPPPPVTPALSQYAARENGFAFALLRSTAHSAEKKDNVFVSPLSVAQAVTMLYAGASGVTQSEIARALHDRGLSEDQVLQLTDAMRKQITASGGSGVDIAIANALWADRTIQFKPTYVQTCSRTFNAQATTLDFTQPRAAAVINGWVSKNTRGKITSIISPNALASMVAALTDAVYFHGRWDSPFDTTNTKSAPFHMNTSEHKKLPMMDQTDSFRVTQNANLQAIALPYAKSNLEMLIVLPRKGHEGALAQTMTPTGWEALYTALKPEQAEIILPRFHVDFSASLIPPLRQMGVQRVFTPAAEMGKMASGNLVVTCVVHKTTLDVDEKGTVATAATFVGVEIAAAMIPPPVQMVIRVDHPFVCAICDKTTGALLFVGYIRNPGALTSPTSN